MAHHNKGDYVVTVYRLGAVHQRSKFKNPDQANDCFDRLERKYGNDDDYYIDIAVPEGSVLCL